MMEVSVRAIGPRYVVVIENKATNYVRHCDEYEMDSDWASTKAQNDAADWVAKFNRAGIKAELVQVENAVTYEPPRRERRERAV